MKKIYFSVCLVLATLLIQAQIPAGFNYQAVIRNETGELVKNKTIGVRFNILKGSENGAMVYSEVINPTTNINGLVTAEIGKINQAQFSKIDWSDGIYFLKTETDLSGGSNYVISGVSQLMSVPYAMYAAQSGDGFSGNYTDLSNKPLFSTIATTGNYSDLSGKPTFATVATSGNYSDLSGKPSLVKIATTGSYSDLTGQPTLATVATSGNYSDLSGKPTFAKIATTGNYADLLGQPILAKVATTGNYSDLSGKPTLATVATSGNYTDLLSKPTLATVATTGNFNDLLNMPILVKLLKNPQAGDIIYNKGTNWELLARGTNGQTLRLDNGMPNWGEPGYALPMVTTSAVTDILQTAATSGGNVIATGFTNITARGVCWSTNQNPTIADNKTSDGSGIGTFNSNITNLILNTTYYLRAYATNSAGTAYGNQVPFKTFLNVVFPTVTTAAATNITSTAVTSGGNVTNTGGGEVTARGVCWSDHQNPTVDDSKTNDGTGTGEFRSQITGLKPGTYYIRAYATNSAGTGYGNMITVPTEKTLPVLTTKAITEISAMGAVSGGNITTAGGGTISARGICWSESPNPTINNDITTSPANTASFSAAIVKANPGTTYYLRAYASNEVGTGYGDEKTFKTSDAAYYQSFETGMIPANWSGQFKVNNETAFEGGYSFKSLDGVDCDETLTLTLAADGQISFYYAFKDGNAIGIFIDDKEIQRFNNNGVGWQQGLINVTAGLHKIRWHFYPTCWSLCFGKCYIDQIIITK